MRPVIPVIPVGPSPADAERLSRVVRAFVRWEPTLEELVILHDGVSPEALRPHVGETPWPVVYVENPRKGRGSPTYDGLACGLMVAFTHVAATRPTAHVLKFDTDGYLIGPVTERVAAYFKANPRVGMVGTLDYECNGRRRVADFAARGDVHRKSLRPLWYWKSSNTWASSWIGRGRRFAAMFRAADGLGHPRGRYVQGGVYALNASMVGAWYGDRMIASPLGWIGIKAAEDVIFSYLTVNAGFELGSCNAVGEIFAVKGVDMPLPIEEIAAGGYAVVHSVKQPTMEREQALIRELDALAARRSI